VCPGCDGDANLTPLGTLAYCRECEALDLTASARERVTAAAARAEHRAEVATRADPLADMRARVGQRAEREALAADYRATAADVDARVAELAVYLPAGMVNLAGRVSAALRALAAEALAAADADALAVVRQVQDDTTAAAAPLAAALAAARAAAEDAEARETARAGYHERLAITAAADEDETEAPPGQVNGTPRPAGPPWAELVTAAPLPPTTTAGAAGATAVMLSRMVLDARRRRERDEALAERYGQCQAHRTGGLFSPRVAPTATRYVVGNASGVPGTETPGAPRLVICGAARCLARADEWFRGQGYPDCTYGELEV
jgi:hypothetical protein